MDKHFSLLLKSVNYKKSFIILGRDANVIKLFKAVIYKKNLISYSARPWKVLTA